MAHNSTQDFGEEKAAPYAQIEIQGHLVTYTLHDTRVITITRNGGGKRGKITGFSKASRWRLLKRLAIVDWGKARLITLTYPSDVDRITLESNMNHLKAFIERWFRHYEYRPTFVWRKEYTKQGIVHYHLLQPKPKWHDDLIEFVSRSWAEILATDRTEDIERAGTKVEFAKSVNQSMSYVAKYIAKTLDEFPEYHKGRIWGMVGQEGFRFSKRHVYAIPISEFFDKKKELEDRIGHYVFARRIDKLRKWW